MSINFPTSLDTLTNPAGTDPVTSPDHALQHSNANDAIEALEAKVGVDSSAVTTSIDYKVKNTASIDPGHKHTEGSITLADVTTDDVTSTKHGFAPKSPADATKFLNGAATPAYALVKDSDLSTTDVTTNNVSTSKHGFAPKGDGDTSKFLNANGAYSSPAAGNNALSLTPYPNYFPGTQAAGAISIQQINTNTTLYVGQVIVPLTIVVNKISIRINNVSTAGTVKVAVFSEDGQTQKISVTTASISAGGVVTTAVAGVTLSAGVYYIAILPVSTTDLQTSFYGTITATVGDLNGSVTSEPIINGSVTVTASTMPATITPGSITDGTTNARTLIFRLDN